MKIIYFIKKQCMVLTTERQKKIKNIWIKIEVEKEIERRGDSIYKVSNEISKEEWKKFCIWNHIYNFFLKIII